LCAKINLRNFKVYDQEVNEMNEKTKLQKQKQKYEPIEIDVRRVDGADVITTSAAVSVIEHDNAYFGFDLFE
jgi:hypothetical protein